MEAWSGASARRCDITQATRTKTVASRMVDCVRATDIVVRLGADEFVVVLLDQPKDIDTISANIQKLASPERRGGDCRFRAGEG
jgi:GGDEF domain-containing protein